MVNHLKSDFTLLLQNDIKVWAVKQDAEVRYKAPDFKSPDYNPLEGGFLLPLKMVIPCKG
jgi:hypothetical protein